MLDRLLNKILELTFNWRLDHGIHTIDELQVGGHCGLCGAWMPDVIVPKIWSWDVCEKCVTEEENELILKAIEDVKKYGTVPLDSI